MNNTFYGVIFQHFEFGISTFKCNFCCFCVAFSVIFLRFNETFLVNIKYLTEIKSIHFDKCRGLNCSEAYFR